MTRIPLSDAKARLSEVVRNVRLRGEEVVVTVDGEPAARIVPVEVTPRDLTPSELATERVILESIRRLARSDPFDAVELVREGRR